MTRQKVDYPEKSCEWCKELFKPNRKDKRFCTTKCYRKYGKKVKGFSQGNPEKLKLKSKIKSKRSHLRKYPYKKYKKQYCEKCNFVAQHSCQLDVDHIDGNHDNNDPCNLQTLCANCHRLKTALQLNW